MAMVMSPIAIAMLILSCAGPARAVGIASRGEAAVSGIVRRASAAVISERGFFECDGCIATFTALQSALTGTGTLSAGDTVVTLCRSTKTAPIVLTEDINIEGEDANVFFNCCGSPEYSETNTAPQRGFRAVKRSGRKCKITRAVPTAGIRYNIVAGANNDPSLIVSSIEFTEGEQSTSTGDSILGGTGAGSIIIFNRYGVCLPGSRYSMSEQFLSFCLVSFVCLVQVSE